MLKELSIRNARRQSRDYSLYFITLVCTVSFMYAFNTLLFSDTVKSLSSFEVLPYMIVAASLLVVLVMGWIIRYMTSYMLKKRSREFSIYMISGISNRKLNTLIFRENMLVGILAFLLGIPVGMLAAQFLQAVLFHLFGMTYTLHVSVSFSAAGLTLLYFFAMLLHSLRKNRKWIRRVSLHDLLLRDRENEKSLLSGSIFTVGIFLVSVVLGVVGVLLVYTQLLGKGYDALIGMICLVLFLFGFFRSVPAFLVAQFADRAGWKYRNNRLVTFRDFTAKIHSKSTVMGMLSILFMLSMTFMGIGTAVCLIADKNAEMSAFDIMILRQGELQGELAYEEILDRSISVQESHTYAIYTDTKQDFLMIRDRTISDTGRPDYLQVAEFQYDTYIRQSDYIRLREILGYELAELNPYSCYVHCVPALEKDFKTLIDQEDQLECAGYTFAGSGVFTEPFSQLELYGNGLDYVIVVPDQAASQMKLLYSLYAALTESPLSNADLQKISETQEGVERIQRNLGRSVPGTNAATFLLDDVDYLSGKWVDRQNISQLYAMAICLFYLALILEITGAAVLATQVLGDREKKQKQDNILRQLGMNERLIGKLNNRQLSLLFLFPLIPAAVISSCFVYICAVSMERASFNLSAFNGSIWIAQVFIISLIFFLLLYGVYYIAARISYGRQ